jgi:hypothetical protein
MKMIQFLSVAMLTVTFGYGQTQLQEVINGSGGSTQNKGYILQWSIGELALVNQMNSTDGSYILTNGFIQPLFETNFPNTILQPASPDIRMFPNPTHDILEIDFLKSNQDKVSLQLTNSLGHILYTNEIHLNGKSYVEKINMKGFTNGIYMLNIQQSKALSGRYDIENNSFKIIKL